MNIIRFKSQKKKKVFHCMKKNYNKNVMFYLQV